MIDYKGFIEYYFKIKTPHGQIVPFRLNEDQDNYYQLLRQDYPTMQGLRENDLKSRRVGWSSLIDAIGMVDFIMAELGKAPLFDGDIVSHKDKETLVLFDRANLFLDSYLEAEQINRKAFLEIDTTGHIKGRRSSEMWVQTASARVSGRGGTKQFIHWSEIAFYSNTEVLNAEDLVTGAEQQVQDGFGKIFRESTGNISDDFFSKEYNDGKKGIGKFKSRFFAWFLHKEYTLLAPDDWTPPEYYDKIRNENGVTINQCYWHYEKTKNLTSEKLLREYPTYDTEAFLLGGKSYFDKMALLWYQNHTRQPIKEFLNVSSL